MTTHDNQDSATPTALGRALLGRLYQPWRKEAIGEFPFKLIFVGFVIAAPIMLVALPSAALAIVHLSECCTNQSMTTFLTFWGGLFAGMLALFGTLIAAVFVISAFRIDKSAKAEARMAAEDAVGDFILEHRHELLKKVDDWANAVESKKDKTIKSIDDAETAVQSRKDDAIGSIDDARAGAESASETAVTDIAGVRDNVVRSGEQATATIEKAAGDVDGRAAAAIDGINAEVAEVERVAAEAKASSQARLDDPPPSDSRD